MENIDAVFKWGVVVYSTWVILAFTIDRTIFELMESPRWIRRVTFTARILDWGVKGGAIVILAISLYGLIVLNTQY